MQIKKGKKAQFYILAALIIIFIIIGLASLSNYVYVKKTPQKFYDLGDALKLEGLQVVDYSLYNKQGVNKNIDSYLNMFSNYIKQNTNEELNLIILYGNASSNQISGKFYSRSTSQVSANIGSSQFQTIVSADLVVKNITATVVRSAGGVGTVNVTITGENLEINQLLPILQDNNFVFIMTTSSGFNNYIQSSIQPSNNE